MRAALAPPPPRWVEPGHPPEAAVRRLAEELRLPRALCAVLVARGVGDVEGAKGFLRPSLAALHPPGLLRDVERAVERLVRARERGETVLVHGDYDADGLCAAALYTRFLRGVGIRAVPFVPHRVRDGYDLGGAGLAAARAAGARVVLTGDCGTSAHGAVEAARARGLDVLVTDHHTPGEELPRAAAVVNPRRPDCPYPEKGLSGTGVAFKVCHALALALGRPGEELWPLLDLVALGTVADVVPLTGENRALVRFGLRALERTGTPGLRALVEAAGLAGRRLEAGHVAYILGPRLNAVGRMGEATRGLELLLADDAGEARRLADRLEAENRRRRSEEERTLEEVLDRLEGRFDPEEDYGVVVAGEGWHPGVIGIVASRVVERLFRPAVVVALRGGHGRGSGRSIPGFHLYRAVHACREHLERYGGHREAAGLELRRDRLGPFREAFNEVARRELEGADLRPTLAPDVEISLGDVTPELHRFLRYVGPFGPGNPEPLFLARGVRLRGEARVVGADHLRLRLVQGEAELDGIGFRLARRLPPSRLGEGPLDAVFHVHEDEYRGERRLRARLVDLRPGGP